MKFLIVFSSILALAYGSKLQGARIVNGELAEEQQFPYQVGLSMQNEDGSYWCGGSLISPEWILSAAHCVHNINSGTAYLGMTKMGKAVQSIPFSANDVITHEDFAKSRNDIALIRIRPVELSDAVSTIELTDGSMEYDNSRAVAIGWGRISDASSVSPNLYYATVIVEPLSECKSTYGTLPQSLICVSTKSGTSTCQGDSGGPLVSRLDRKLIGITSFGSRRGCEAGVPVAFTRISYFLDWIQAKCGLKLK